MSNFFKGLQNLNTKIFFFLVVGNIIWFNASDGNENVWYLSDMPELATFDILEIVFFSTIVIVAIGMFIHWIFGSFVVDSKTKYKDEIKKSDFYLKNIEKSLDAINNKLDKHQLEFDKIKERQYDSLQKSSQNDSEK